MIFPSFTYDIRDRAIVGGIVAVLLLSTIVTMPFLQSSVRNGKIFMLGVVCLGALGVIISRKTVTGALLTFYVALNLFLSVSESMGSAMYQMLCYAGLFVLLGLTEKAWRRNVAWIYNAICIIALANVAAQLVQLCGVSFPRGLQPHLQHGFVGLMGNVNETSALLAVCLPFFFRRRWAWCLPAVAAGLVMARTTNGALAAVIITFIWVAIRHRRYLFVTFCACIAMSTMYLLIDPPAMPKQLSGRGVIYKATAVAASVNPVMGWGFGQYDFVMPLLTFTGHMMEKDPREGAVNIRFLYDQVADKKALDTATVKWTGKTKPEAIRAHLHDVRTNASAMFIQAHNEYLEMFFAAGLAGIVFLITFICQTLHVAFRRKDIIPALALTASALTALLFFVWQIVPIAILTVACLAIVYQEDKHEIL
jgi:hypothetical protein